LAPAILEPGLRALSVNGLIRLFSLWIRTKKCLSDLNDLRIEKVLGDGIQFLLDNFHHLKQTNTIVPALPVHLVYEWLIQFLPGDMKIGKLTVPETKPPLPNAWPASEGSMLVSYADFLCPDDCPEPVHCTITGENGTTLVRALKKSPFASFQSPHYTQSSACSWFGGIQGEGFERNGGDGLGE